MKKNILFLFALAALLVSCTSGGGKEEDTSILKAGDPVPAFHVDQDLVGEDYRDFTSPQDFEGKNTLLVFFTTTCPDCQREIPFAKRVWDDLGTDEVNVVCISRGYKPDYMPHKFWEDYKLGDMPWFIDTDGEEAYAKFATGYVPRFYLVGKDGRIVWMKVENLGYGKYTDEKGKQFVELVKKQLNLK